MSDELELDLIGAIYMVLLFYLGETNILKKMFVLFLLFLDTIILVILILRLVL